MGFIDYFGMKPPVSYTREIIVPSRLKKDFKKSYAAFFKKHRCRLSKTRKKHLDIMFARKERSDDDCFYNDKIELRYLSKKLGYGIFAKVNIPRYTTLLYYTGELVLTKNLNPDHDCTFSFEYFDKYSIDAMHKGNWTRFMNHSDIESPNCNVCVWEYYRKDFPYIVFTSGKNGIKKGAQLLYSYGDEYWENRDFKKL